MSPNWHSFRFAALWGWHQLLTLALAALVLVAIVVGLGRQFTPAVSEYHAAIEARLTKAIGVPVRIEQVMGRWQGMTPFFQVDGLQLRDPANPGVALLRIPRLELRPSLWRSLLALEPRIDLRVRGLDIHLEQLPDGSMRMRELASLSRSDPAAARRALEVALRQPVLALEEGRLELALQGYPVLRFSRINLVNRNEGVVHRLAGEVHLASVRKPVALNMVLQGNPVEWQKGVASLWLALPVLDLDDWLPSASVAGVGLQSARGGGEFWLHFAQGRLTALQARPALSRVVFSSAMGTHQLQDVSGELEWQRQGGDWQLSVQRLVGRLDNLAWPVPSLSLKGNGEQISVAAAEVGLRNGLLLANRLALPAPLAAWLREATPDGRLVAARVDLAHGADGQWHPQRVDARFDRLAAHSTERFPGADNLAGWLRWTPEGGMAGLSVQNGRLDLRQIFREPVVVSRLQGAVRWRQTPEQWVLESTPLQLSNADANGQALVRLTLPRQAADSPHLSLLARLTRAQVASAWRYVPWPPAGDNTLAWLRRSLVAGTVTTGDFLVEGPVHPAPGDPPLRQVMRFELSDAALDYQPGWPALRALDGVVTIDGRHLRVEATRASLLDGTLATGVVADIPDLRQARLAVTGDVQATGPDLMRLFRESPLRAHTAAVADNLALEGLVRGRLALDIPLSHALPPGPLVTVNATLAGNRLRLPKLDLQAEELTGDVRFTTARGLEASVLRGRLLGAEVTAGIASSVRRNVLQAVDVAVDGRVAAPALQRWLGGPVWQALSGEAPYEARIHIPSGSETAQLRLSSSLAGMRILLPPPLAKGTEPLQLRYQSSLGKGEQMARLQIGRVLAAGLVWRESGLHGALFRLNGTDVGWPSSAGIEVEGRVARMSLAEWQPWLDRFSSASPGQRGARVPGLSRLEVDARDMEAQGWRLRDVRLAVRREPAAWRLGLNNSDVAGSLLMPDASAADWNLDIERLVWPLPGAPDMKGAGGMAQLPSSRPLRVRLQELRLREYPGLGPVSGEARLSPSPYGMRMDDLKLASALAAFDGRLDWQWRGGDSTRLRGAVTSSDVAGLLKGLHYVPSLQSRLARAEFDLSWPAAPQSLALQGLDGNLSVRVEDGRLLNVNAATSASRVFGLVDIENIRRRLKGDFSDVLMRGLSFDAVTLAGPVQGGVMPKAVFDLTGPSLTAHGEGRLDLARQQIDQTFTVNVPVSSAVPLAAAVVAGPLVGGAVAAAELALKKQIQKVTVMHYRISGDWSDPEVSRLSQRPGKPPTTGARP